MREVSRDRLAVRGIDAAMKLTRNEQIREMAEGAVEARGGDHAGNFMQLHVEDIVSILKSAR